MLESVYDMFMHPKNNMFVNGAAFGWLADYGGDNGAKSAKHYHKKKCRRMVRRDGAKQIRQALDNME